MIATSVPSLPPVPAGTLSQHAAAHAELAAAIDTVSPHVQSLFRFLQHRLAIESLANVQPTLAVDAPLLFPTPRTFLSPMMQRRMAATAAAVRHVDARITMARNGLISQPVEPSTPIALHALFEASNPASRETNPGMLRATATGWMPDVNPFVHAPGPQCPELVEAAIDVATRAPAPAIARAGWLTFTMLSIHPFVDGNGRTSRMLFHAIAANELTLGFDWGIAEQWSLRRDGYIAALQAGQRVGEYDPERLDAQPFMEFSAEASALGARVCSERVRLLEKDHGRLVRDGFDADAATVVVAVRLQRIATLGELARLGLGERLADIVMALVDAGVLRWTERHAGWRTVEHPDPLGLAVAH